MTVSREPAEQNRMDAPHTRGSMMAKTLVVTDQTTSGMQLLKSQPERLTNFLKDVRSEMRKVIAPTREEVQSTTLIVLVTVFLFAAYFWAVDAFANQLIERGIASLTRH